MDYVKLPKTKRGEKTLQKICIAAEELFAQKGYYDTEIHDITQKAGIAVGTLYLYFSDKLSLFLYLMDNLGRELRRAIRLAKGRSPSDSIIEQERISMRTYYNFIKTHYGLFRIIWQAQFVDPEAFKRYYERFSSGYIVELKKAQESGEMKNLDPALVSYALMGIYSFVSIKYFIFDGKEPGEAEIDQLVDLVARGLLN
jgi:AcrR family transcriptional regulator